MGETVSERICLNVSYSQNGPKWTKINGQDFPLESQLCKIFLWIFKKKKKRSISIIKRTLSLVYSPQNLIHIFADTDTEPGSEGHGG